MPSREIVFGFECSGNRGPLNGLSSNGRWTGVPLRAVLDQAGVKPEAREFVFFGADHGEEEVEFRGRTVLPVFSGLLHRQSFTGLFRGIGRGIRTHTPPPTRPMAIGSTRLYFRE